MSWLWKSDTTSPAAFEKALSKLSGQIAAVTLSLETTRSRGRRFKALWTLYTTLAYLVFLVILVLMIDYHHWTFPHYGGLLGGPVTIYAVRLAITKGFDWRAGRQQAHLSTLEKQRAVKVADLKKATKFDSTQELLQKYGGVPARSETPSKQSPTSGRAKGKKQAEQQVQRTGIPPPPTANIQSKQVQQSPNSTPQRPSSRNSVSAAVATPQSPISPDEPGFAPNAFPAPPPSRANYVQTTHWYDRILDVMLGEDESLAKNRLVLLCQSCRLVNGQAPPGVKTLEQLGKWRCGSCGTWNGTESAGAKAVREVMEQPQANASEEWQPVNRKNESKDEAESIVSEEIAEDKGRGTGKSSDDDSGIIKRVTRSAGQEPVDGL